MKTAYIISSTKNLDYDFEHLHWLRLFFLSEGYHIAEDWINHSLHVRNNKPYLKNAPNFDYLQVATRAIQETDKLVFLLSSDSAFVTTLLRYALHQQKQAIVVCKNKIMLRDLKETKGGNVVALHFSDYQKRIKEFV